MVILKRGKLYAIMGYARIKLGHFEEGYKHLLDALDCYGKAKEDTKNVSDILVTFGSKAFEDQTSINGN